ncbi:LIM domain-containing protein ajuba [Siphateles boraxobius]|uniref:LIM domain-containing protein ajuba n=1 Tax=Siphateles boraxobius TaxID=180520 RepID=UPI00406386CE
MDRLGSKLKQKLKLSDSGSVKFSKKKNDLANANNNSNSNNANNGTATQINAPVSTPQFPLSSVEVCGQSAGRTGISQRITSSNTTSAAVSEDCGPGNEHHPSTLAPLRRRSPQQRASCYLPETAEGRNMCDQLRRGNSPRCEGDPLGAYSSNSRVPLKQRRYSLELQQLVRRQQLLAQPPPLSSVPPPYLYPRSSAVEPSFLHDLERHKRLSLQEALFYKRLSSGGEPWDSGRPASLSHPPQRTHDSGVGGFFFPPAPALSPCSSFSLQESVLASPRSSFASSTASGGGGGGGSPMGSRCSSNRTSGISLGYDTRHTPGPGQQLQLSSTQLGGATSGQVYSVLASGKTGVPPVEIWRETVLGGSAHDSRHSYPPALSTHTATLHRAEPEWGPIDQRGSRGEDVGERARHSDLPGTRYQQELTRLILSDAALEGEALLGGLTLKEQPVSTTILASSASTPATAGVPGKSLEEQSAGRESSISADRQEYFGTCVKCGKGVYGADNACQALDSLYHTRCFTCVSCGRTLRNKDFYNVSGSVYCKEDYMFSGFQDAAEKCSVCGHLILEQILQALGNSYHPGCFRCTVCSKALDGVPFTVDYLNNVYCVSDYNRTFAPKCAACLQPILPAEGSEEILRVVSMNKDYHFECYHCEECGKQLSDELGSQCFPLDSHLLCHSCHMTRVCHT